MKPLKSWPYLLHLSVELCCSHHGLESRISSEYHQLFNRIKKSIIFAVTIVIHKSRNLIAILRISEFGPKLGHVIQSNVMSLP